jgi:hypothetical protein
MASSERAGIAPGEEALVNRALDGSSRYGGDATGSSVGARGRAARQGGAPLPFLHHGPCAEGGQTAERGVNLVR